MRQLWRSPWRTVVLLYFISIVIYTLVLVIAMQALIGHLLAYPTLYHWGVAHAGMAINTAICLVSLSSAGLCVLAAVFPLLVTCLAGQAPDGRTFPDAGC